MSKRWLTIGAILAYSVLPLAMVWSAHMDMVGAAIDAYPSRWIHGLPFLALVLVGSLSGWVTTAAFLPKITLRWTCVAAALTTFSLFMATVKLNFECWSDDFIYRDVPYPLSYQFAQNLSFVAIVLWLVSLVAAPVALLWTYHKRRTQLKQDSMGEKQT